LGLADEEHPFVAGEGGPILLGDVILPLIFLKGQEVDVRRGGEVFDRLHELLAHGCHDRGRRDTRSQVLLHEVDDATARLQRGHVSVQVHAIDRFQFEGDVLVEDFSNTFAYHRLGAPGERGPCGHRPPEGLLPRRRGQPLPAPGTPLFLTRPCLRPAGAVDERHHMLDGLRQGLVRHLLMMTS
jgi:hypothetical protein